VSIVGLKVTLRCGFEGVGTRMGDLEAPWAWASARRGVASEFLEAAIVAIRNDLLLSDFESV